MKMIFVLIASYSSICLAQTNDLTPTEMAGICQGHNIFMSALSAHARKNLNMQCNFENVKKLGQMYKNNKDFQKFSTNTNNLLIESFNKNDPRLGIYTIGICVKIGISPCTLE